MIKNEEIENELEKLDGWQIRDGKLFKSITFNDFIDAFGFISKLAIHCEKINHHPELYNIFNTVTLNLVTHETGKISIKDIQLAKIVNGLLQNN